MGIFGPGFQVLGNYMNQMQAQLANNAMQYNCESMNPYLPVWYVRLNTFHNIDLGATSWLGIGERSTANQLMFATYFRTLEDVHAYAHSQLHREAWDWWNNITKLHPHLSIMHEVYQAPKNHWENIYINNHLTGIGGSSFAFYLCIMNSWAKIWIAATQSIFRIGAENQNAENMWINPIFDAEKGKLKTHKGRLQKTDGDDNEKIFTINHRASFEEL